MAQEVRQFRVTIPAGTTLVERFTQALDMPPREVLQIDIKVPPGPRGTMGFSIGSSGQQIIPYGIGEYIVTDDEKMEWALEQQIDSGSWELFGYNTGDFDHTVYITFLVNPITTNTGLGVRQPLQLGS